MVGGQHSRRQIQGVRRVSSLIAFPHRDKVDILGTFMHWVVLRTPCTLLIISMVVVGCER